MMKRIAYIAGPLLILILIWSSVYTIRENEQAIIIQFGKPIGEAITSPGLHFKVPFIQEVIRFEKRIMEWDGDADEIPTRDKKYIFIDAFARWQITDALQFYKSTKNERMAQSRLDDIIDGSVRDEISNRVMIEIIRYTEREMVIHDVATADPTMATDTTEAAEDRYKGARLEIIQSILQSVSTKLDDLELGIKVVDIQLKRIDYNQQVQEKLFNRMVSDQNRIAEKYRAQGQGEKENIMGMTEQKKKEILSSAYLKAQKIRGDADAIAVKIYADTYGQSPEFYNFLRSLETYENTLDSSTKFILSTDNKYLQYLEKGAN